MEILNTEVVDQAEDLDRIEGEIAIISADQVLQNERLLELEMDSDGKTGPHPYRFQYIPQA